MSATNTIDKKTFNVVALYIFYATNQDFYNLLPSHIAKRFEIIRNITRAEMANVNADRIDLFKLLTTNKDTYSWYISLLCVMAETEYVVSAIKDFMIGLMDASEKMTEGHYLECCNTAKKVVDFLDQMKRLSPMYGNPDFTMNIVYV